MSYRSNTITHEEILAAGQAPAPRLELLRIAAAIVDGIPARRFSLNVVRERKAGRPGTYKPRSMDASCGSVCCGIGWLTLHPSFQALGLGWDAEESVVTWNDRWQSFPEAGSKLFGITWDEAHRLFRELTYQEQEGPESADMHKRIFRKRVVEFLQRHEQVAT